MTNLWSKIVTAVGNRLRTTVGKRFSRFAVAAVAAVAASQITLALCLGTFGWTAGKSALAAWVAGAGTSYLVSRWAWERRGRPHLLKETVPFWVVAVGAAIVLTTTTKIANQHAIALGLSHTQKLIFVGSAYFAANCVTFVTRFVIFHYVLFKDRMAAAGAATAGAATGGAATAAATGGAAAGQGGLSDVPGEAPGPVPSPALGLGDRAGGGPATVNGSAARVNGSSAAWAATKPGTLPTDPGTLPTDPGTLPEPETQR